MVESTVSDLLSATKKKLKSCGIESPDLDARPLLQAVLKIDHTDILAGKSRPVTEIEKQNLFALADQRCAGKPVSRILGKRDFWTLTLELSEETLDPRPDSETLVESVLKHTKKTDRLKILDLGTGTGCLLLSVLAERPEATGLGIDISADAVSTAKKNAQLAGLEKRATFQQTSWISLEESGFDVVISNPPYIPKEEIRNLSPEVALFDPLKALDGGVDGLSSLREIAQHLEKWIKPGGMTFLEMGPGQTKKMQEILAQNNFSVLEVVPDLAGRDRCLVVT